MADSVLSLVAKIHEGSLVLPDIQRSFVWDEEQIYELMDSLFRGYPVGSFLFWKAIGSNDPEKSVVYHRFVETYQTGADLPVQTELKENETKTFVLDGQQRLSSLYLSIIGTYNGRDLYIDLLSGTDPKDEEAGISYFVKFMDLAELNNFTQRNPHRKMARLKEFIRIPNDAIKMYKKKRLVDYFGLAPGSPEHLTAFQVVDDVRAAVMSDTQIPVKIIDEQAMSADECKSLDEVAEIFVRVNDGGTKLSRIDLIFSLMKSRWPKASEEIAALCNEVNSIGDFQITKDFVILCLMVFSGRSARYKVDQIRKSGLMEEFREIFPQAKKAISGAFDFLREKRGGAISTWRLLSGGQRADRGYNVLIPIGLYLYLRPNQEMPEKEYRRVRKYLYASVLSRYAVKYVETRIDHMAKLVRAAKDRGEDAFPIDDAIKIMQEDEHFTEIAELIGRSNTLDPLLNILAGGNVGFATLLDRNAPHRDHIFPHAKLNKMEVPEELINHYANMHLLGAISNIKKNDEDPDVYFAPYDAEVLASDDYLIPKELLSYEKYDAFLEMRTAMIQKRVAGFLADSQMAWHSKGTETSIV